MKCTKVGPPMAGGPGSAVQFGDWNSYQNNHPPDLLQSIFPDKEAAADFVHFLDPKATKFTLQTFDDSPKKRPSLIAVIHSSLDDCWNTLCSLSKQGAGIFVVINETDLLGRKAENIVRVRCLFADLDGAPLSAMWRIPLEPGWVNKTSDGRYHVYWLVSDIELGEFRDLQKRIVCLTGGDPVVCDLPRVMRMPGLVHQKSAPIMVEGTPVGTQPVTNTRAAVFAALPAPKPAPQPAPHLGNPALVTPIRRGTQALLAARRYALCALESEAAYVRQAANGSRNDQLNRSAFALGTLVCLSSISVAEVEQVLTNAALSTGLSPNEIAMTLRSGLAAGLAKPRQIGPTP